jgi:hypothetical protein
MVGIPLSGSDMKNLLLVLACALCTPQRGHAQSTAQCDTVGTTAATER